MEGAFKEIFAAVVLWWTTITQVYLDGTTVSLDSKSYPRISSTQKFLNLCLLLILFSLVHIPEWYAMPMWVSFFNLKQHKAQFFKYAIIW
jgi:hypothetical protein